MAGFSLFELGLVVIVITLLSGVLLIRVAPLMGQAERIAFSQTRQRIQNVLVLEAAERIARGESATLSKLAEMNPIDLLPDPPVNYLGTLTGRGDSGVPDRSWYFNDQAGTVVYQPGGRTPGASADPIELRVDFAWDDRDLNGKFNASIDGFVGLGLESLNDDAGAWP